MIILNLYIVSFIPVVLSLFHIVCYFSSSLPMYSFTQTFINCSTVIGPRMLLQFSNLIHSWQDSLDGDSARRKASPYTLDNRNRINAHTAIHASGEIKTQDFDNRMSEDSLLSPMCTRLCFLTSYFYHSFISFLPSPFRRGSSY
jgi:hypothetical protein